MTDNEKTAQALVAFTKVILTKKFLTLCLAFAAGYGVEKCQKDNEIIDLKKQMLKNAEPIVSTSTVSVITTEDTMKYPRQDTVAYQIDAKYFNQPK